MAIEITVPRLGWTMEEGVFLGWLKQDQRIGQLVWLVGVLVYLVAVIGGYFALNATPKQQEAAEAVIN